MCIHQVSFDCALVLVGNVTDLYRQGPYPHAAYMEETHVNWQTISQSCWECQGAKS